MSNLGRVRGWRGAMGSMLTAPRIMAARFINGYAAVIVCVNGKHGAKFVHHWVALVFLGPRPPGMVLNHKDGMSLNNTWTNLEYVTQGENVRHALRMGLQPIEERHPRAKLTREQVIRARAAVAAGDATRRELAARFGVSRAAIDRAVAGLTWKTLENAIPTGMRCKRGHPTTPENRITVGGKSRCRLCRRLSQDAWIARDRAKRQGAQALPTAA